MRSVEIGGSAALSFGIGGTGCMEREREEGWGRVGGSSGRYIGGSSEKVGMIGGVGMLSEIDRTLILRLHSVQPVQGRFFFLKFSSTARYR